MIPVLTRVIVNLESVLINCIAITVTFTAVYRLRTVIGIFSLFTAVLAVILFWTGGINVSFGGVLGSYGGVYGLLYIPPIIHMYKGLSYQKIFVVVAQLLISVAQCYLVMTITEIFIPYGGDDYFLLLLFTVSIVYAVNIWLMLKYGWSFMKRLFASGSRSEWAMYTLGAVISYTALMLLHDSSVSKPLYIFFLIFILWGFVVICYAIINTHEKTKQRYDAEFARNIVSTGRDHYQKMDAMYNTLRVLRHDYKYHLLAVREMLRSGNPDGADQYLTSVETELSEHDLPNYCPNPVINALVAGYAERCQKMNIMFSVDVGVLKDLRIPNYEICIIIGNLLENAVEACEKCRDGRTLALAAQKTSAQLIIMTKNSFNGTVNHTEGLPVSEKPNGGFGLQSVKAVATRYGGDLLTEWDKDFFTAYVTVRM